MHSKLSVIYAATLAIMACAGSSNTHHTISTENVVDNGIDWVTAIEHLRLGRIRQVIETESNVVWFVDADGSRLWAKMPVDFAWSDELRGLAEFHSIIVD